MSEGTVSKSHIQIKRAGTIVLWLCRSDKYAAYGVTPSSAYWSWFNGAAFFRL